MYWLKARPGGVRVIDDRDEQVAMIEVPPGTNLRNILAAAGWRIVRASSGYTGRVFVERDRRRL